MNKITYTLINKETPLCDFIIEGEGEVELCRIVKEYAPLPFWCKDIDSWCASRSAAKHRTHVNKIDFDEYLSRRPPVIGSDYVAPARAILTSEIRKCVEEVRETALEVPCDDKFMERRLEQMNMIKNVQCERILGFDASWEF